MNAKSCLCLIAIFVSAGISQEKPEWDNIPIFKVNLERPHASMMIYPSPELAIEAKRAGSPWFHSMNGDWKFNCADSPATRPVDFFRMDFDDTAWHTIPVPSNYQLQGCDIPIYTNAAYSFPMNTAGPPVVPRERNSVGSYRKYFTIPDDWTGRQTFVHFDGVDSAFYLWVNGSKVGYNEDSRTPAEFNITRHIKPGKNLLAVEVYRFSDGSFLEDQDMFRLSGIYRDVYLWCTENQHIRDFEVQTDLDENYRNAALRVKMNVINYSGRRAPGSVRVELLDASGRSVLQRQSKEFQAGLRRNRGIRGNAGFRSKEMDCRNSLPVQNAAVLKRSR